MALIRRQENLTVSTPRHKLVIVMCIADLNIGLRKCPEKMSSLGGPTLKKIEKKIIFYVWSKLTCL